jgi:putative spermidine/putrescine transport system permease protein
MTVSPERVRGAPAAGAGAPRSWVTRLSGVLHARPRLRLAGLLSVPMAWLLVAYLGSLAVMFTAAFWSVDSFTGDLVRQFTLDNLRELLTAGVYRTIALAFFMAKVAPRGARVYLVVAVLTPLWASYLVKAYAWRGLLTQDGLVSDLLRPFGLDTPGYGVPAVILTLAYLWLPYMILPIYAGLDRLPDSLLEASGDLGAGAWRTFRSVVLPLTFPAIVAGSIFTFALSLGDYITVKIVGGATQMAANVIYDNIGVAGNLPFAAAAAFFPVVVIVVYLVGVRRTGALDNL